MRIGRDSVAGSSLGSSAGTTMCAVMIESIPAAIADRNGGASSSLHWARVWVIVGSP